LDIVWYRIPVSSKVLVVNSTEFYTVKDSRSMPTKPPTN